MKKIVVTPINMHFDILKKYRENDPFSDIKIISKEQLISSIVGQIDSSFIPKLMEEKSLSYDNASSLISYLPFVINNENNYKFKFLYEIKELALNNGYLKKVEYFDRLFIEKEVEVIGYSIHDEELKYIFESLNIKPSYIPLNKENKKLTVYKNVYVEDEVFNTLNRIASLLDNNEDINNIYIYVNDEDYLYYLDKYKKDFGFEINTNVKHPLIFQGLTLELLKVIEEAKDFNSGLEFLTNYQGSIKEHLIEEINKIKDLPYSFKVLFEYFKGELERTSFSNGLYQVAVNVIDKPIYKENAHIFVLNFKQGVFPKVFKDNEYLVDEDKTQIHLNTALTKGKIDLDIFEQFFNSDNHIYISFSKKARKEDNLLSPMVKSLSMKEENDQYPDVMYSKKQASYLLCKLTDVAKLYKEETPTYAALNKLINIDYQTYSNEYTNTNVYFPNTHLTHSYTAINMYYECPFKYYLSKILKIDPFETNFNAEFGTVVHETLRQINESNYDFDKLYDIEVNKRSWNASDLVFLDRLKPMMKEASDAILLHKRYMVNPSFVLETKLKFPLNQYADLEGRIDKLIVLDNKFLVVVDYKTGDPKIQLDRLQDGSSLQLPTYALLAANDPVYSKLDAIGLYIHSFNNKSLTKEDLGDKLIPSYLRLSGITTTNYEYAAYLDNSIAGKGTRSSFISGYAVTAKNEVKASKTNIDPQQLSNYIDVTKQLYLDADSRIRNNSFPISPKFYGDDDNACKYCPYRDICFLRSSQIRNMKGSDDDE